MAAIVQRLQSNGIELPVPCNEGSKTWQFQHKISKKDINYFRNLVENHQSLNIEYSVHSAQLAHDLLRKNTIEVIQQIEAALLMAELLEVIYRDYLIVPREAIRLRNEQQLYRSMLVSAGYDFITDTDHAVVDTQFTKNVRERTAIINWSRLLIGRIRRFFALLSPVINDSSYSNMFTGIDRYTGPVLNYASWPVFIPRLSTNLFLTAKHLFPGSWMSEQEKALGWQTRLKAQLSRRGFELGNDSMAMTVNIINCFVLIGALSPLGLYATVASLAFDVFYACLRFYIEVGRVQKLEQQYRDRLKSDNLPLEEREHIKEYLFHLHQRIAYEEKRIYIQISLTSSLLLAFALTLPFFMASPLLPMIGALLSIIVTIGYYMANKKLEQQKPTDKITPAVAKESSLKLHGFFKPVIRSQTDLVPDPENSSSEDRAPELTAL